MKTTILIATLLCLAATFASAGQYVNGYIKRDGTYVEGYYKSSPDSSYNNNYSVQGNTNPYSGKSGTERSTWNDKSPETNVRTYGDPGYNSTYQYKPYGR